MNDKIDIFLPYQKKYILDNSKTAVYIKSRRIGITWAESFRAVIETLNSKWDYNFVSANLKTSQEFIKYARTWVEVINQSAGTNYIDISDATTTEIRFPQGNKIIALSSNPDALRGRSGSCVLDEIAFHEQPEEIFKAAQPLPMWGGTFRMISSMSSPDSYFSQIVERIESGDLQWNLHKTTILDAVDQGLALKVPGDHLLSDCPKTAFIENLKAEVGNDAAWQQEYLCIPSSESTLISQDEYDKVALDIVPEDLEQGRKYGDLFIGVDIGRFKDLTVVWVLERGYDKEAPPHLRDVYRTVAVKAVQNMPFEAQFQLISKYLSLPNVIKCCIDRSGLGQQLSEQLYNEHGSLVEGVAISAPEKQSLVERTIKFISQERVSLPKSADIRSDIICMRRIVTKNGNVSYNGKSSIGHADYHIALAMALRAADKSSNVSLLTSD